MIAQFKRISFLFFLLPARLRKNGRKFSYLDTKEDDRMFPSNPKGAVLLPIEEGKKTGKHLRLKVSFHTVSFGE